MLIAISALKGYAIESSDGTVATVGDFLFDDVTWKVRWIVAEAGTWLTDRKLLLHPSAIRSVDYEREVLVSVLTRAQVEASPPIFEHEPVSLQVERNLSSYYGADKLWGDGTFATALVAPPLSMGARFGDEAACQADDRCHLDGDPHLRSAFEVTSYKIHATDGMVGHAENFLVDDARWEIRFVIVDTRNWWPGKHVLVAPSAVRDVDYVAKEIKLSLNREQVRSTPDWDPIAMIDRVYDKKVPSGDDRHGIGF